MAVMMAIVSLAGCKQDNGNEDASSDETATSVNVPDPEGTVTVNVSSSSVSIGAINIYTTESGNFLVTPGNAEILFIGKGNGLGDLDTTTFPSSRRSQECAIVQGGLYMCAYHRDHGYPSYYGLFVVSYNGSVATIKYCPFEPGEGWK